LIPYGTLDLTQGHQNDGDGLYGDRFCFSPYCDDAPDNIANAINDYDSTLPAYYSNQQIRYAFKTHLRS